MNVERLIIIGDEAWLPEEWEAEQRRRERVERRRAYQASPERRQKRNEAKRRWNEANREHVRAYNREWHRRRRGMPGDVLGSLHALACKGPTKVTGCVCKKIKVYGRRVAP